MSSPADAFAVRAFLTRAARRVTLLLVIHGITTGLLVAVVITVFVSLRHGSFVPPLPRTLFFAVLGGVIGAFRGATLERHTAATVEAKAPACRNLLVTAKELLDEKQQVGEYVAELVYRDAAAVISSLRFNDLFPLRGALTAVAVASALWIFAATRHESAASAAASRAAGSAAEIAISALDATIKPPAYAAQSATTLHDPARITTLTGSTILLAVRSTGDSVAIETLRGRQYLHLNSAGAFTGEVVADADGFLAIEPIGKGGLVGERRLIGLSILPDEAPHVQITAPGHDLKFAEGRHTLDVALEANDDIGLASLKLHYTRVSGSGERFTFTDGEVPLTITRTDRRHWKAHVAWKLDSLALGPGDMVVYRAVAADDRPGAAPTESDSYIAEVLAPGGVAAAGFATDPEVERYALSEQMVILKTVQLQAKKLVPDSLADAAAEIASEQRRVRAEFVFMMGGEIGSVDDESGDLNEVAETSGEGDLAAARMLNQGRAALLSAIRLMSRADKLLTKADLDAALAEERAALVQLELTFSHSRLILRALTERERLDMTRRLSGTLTDAASNGRPVAEPPVDAHAVALRKILADISALSAVDSTNAALATRAAERVLRLDPASKPMQQVAQQLSDAAAAIARHKAGDARTLLDKAATGLSVSLRAELLNAPRPGPSLGDARLAGALVDALHRPAGTP